MVSNGTVDPSEIELCSHQLTDIAGHLVIS